MLNTNGRNAMLTGGLGNVITHISLHSSDPGSTGAGEISGGAPAYARQAVTWAAASAGTRASSGALTFDIPAGTTVLFAGFWSAITAGTNYGYSPIGSGAKGFGTADSTTDVITSAAHGLVLNDAVVLTHVFSESLPTGVSEGPVYYVRDVTTDSFKLTTTAGGTAIDLTTRGEMYFQRIIPETFGSQGTLTIPAGSLVLDATTV